MSNTLDFEFGRPSERQCFIKNHNHFFRRLPNLQKALEEAFALKNNLLRTCLPLG